MNFYDNGIKYNTNFVNKVYEKRRIEAKARRIREAEEREEKRREAFAASLREIERLKDELAKSQEEAEYFKKIGAQNAHLNVRSLGRLSQRICRLHGITLMELTGTGRTRHEVKARAHFCYLGQKLGRSSTQIGRFLNRDHSSVLHLIKRWPEIKAEMKSGG